MDISNINELAIGQILDDTFKKYLESKGKTATLNFLGNIFSGGKSNEELILHFFTQEVNSVQELSLKSGFNENKVTRILKRLNKND